MTNGLNINVSESAFKEATQAEQSWMIYKAVEKIDKNGCNYGKTFHKKDITNRIIIFGTAFGGAVGSAIAVWALLLK